MTRLIALTALIAASTGCVVYTHDRNDAPAHDDEIIYVEPAPEINYTPIVLNGDASVYWDGYYGDDVWYFEAVVDDPNGVYDVVDVWADVYDEWRGGVCVESFQLFPTEDPYLWYSDWLGSTTYLDPFYGGYTVDLVAYDVYDDYDWMTVTAYTYAF